MNLLVQLSSGYPRIVEALSFAYKDLCQENPNSLSRAVGIVRRALGERRLLIHPSIENIVPALLGKDICITSKLPDGSGQSYAALIQDGTFIVQSWEYRYFVPTLPLLPLYIWASEHTTAPTSTLFEFMKRCVDYILAIHKKVDPQVFQGEGFKLIHAWFLVLRLQLEAVERKNTPHVFLLYPVDKVSNMKELMDPLLKTRNCLNNEEQDVEQTLIYFLEKCRTTPETTVVLPVGGNFPGTDILVFKSNAKCGVSLSLQQCKYLGATSEPFNTTDLNNCLDQLKKTWEAYGLTLTRSGADTQEPTNSPLPFGPLKNLQMNVELIICGKVAASLPLYDEVKVYPEHKLKHLYGPTLFPLLRPTLD